MSKNQLHLFLFFFFLLFFGAASESYAAILRVSPDTGVYTVGGIFTASVIINTEGKPVNAAEGQLSFNPRELSVVSVSRGSSIFNLWTQEPAFSNGAGTITFGGGSPTGYTGSQGTVMTVTFRTVTAGNPKVNFKNGSVLAADGMGTNVLKSMNGASYTISAAAATPEPEYIAPANTPQAPKVTSNTHPDPSKWYQSTTAELSWSVPSDVTSVRTLLDENPGTIPTIVYEEPVTEKTLTDLVQGVSYFHIQFRNSEGWGRVAHYRIGVDTEPPTNFVIKEGESEAGSPEKVLTFHASDTSPLLRYLIQIDGGEAIEFIDEEEAGRFTLPTLLPGRHTVIIEAFDSAGNSTIGTHAFDVASFDKPVFTEYPSRINDEVIPVLKGSTRPNSDVEILVQPTNGEAKTYHTKSDENGAFVFIPDSVFPNGVYDISAVATDQYGAQSDPSDTIRIAVEEPGYIRVGSLVVSFLSVLVPIIVLILFLVFGVWFLGHRLSRWRKYVIRETKEAEKKLALEFDTITTHLAEKVAKLKKSKKGSLTAAEEELINEIRKDIESARDRIQKEISDIDDIVE